MPFPITAGRRCLERNASRFPECRPGILLSVMKCCLSQKRRRGNSVSCKIVPSPPFSFNLEEVLTFTFTTSLGPGGKLSFCLCLSLVRVSLASGPFIRGEGGLSFPITFMPQCVPVCSPPASSKQDPFSTVDGPRCPSLPALPRDGARSEGV